MMDKLLIIPIRRTSILIGRVIADAATMLAQGSIIVVIAVLMGVRPESGLLGTLALIAYAAPFGVVGPACRTSSPCGPETRDDHGRRGPSDAPGAVPDVGLLPRAAAAGLAADGGSSQPGLVRDRDRTTPHEHGQRLGSGHPNADRSGGCGSRPGSGVIAAFRATTR